MINPSPFWFNWLMAVTIGFLMWLSVMLIVYLINYFQIKKRVKHERKKRPQAFRP